MSALLPESLHALGWPTPNGSSGLALAVAAALSWPTPNASSGLALAGPSGALAADALRANASALASFAPAAAPGALAAAPAPAALAPAGPFTFPELAGALILAAVLAAVAFEARNWVLQKRALELEAAFEAKEPAGEPAAAPELRRFRNFRKSIFG